MVKSNNKFILNIVAFCGLFFAGLAQAQPPTGPMSFFVTSQGSGNGGDLGGLAGADEICQNLAESVDQGHLTWRAYLSTQGDNAVNARDRIGLGREAGVDLAGVGDISGDGSEAGETTALDVHRSGRCQRTAIKNGAT